MMPCFFRFFFLIAFLLISLEKNSSFAHTAEKVIPVVIIGSGCAGLSAGHVTSEYGYETIVFSGPFKGGDLNAQTVVGNWLGILAAYGSKIMGEVLGQTTGRVQLIDAEIVSADLLSSPFKLKDSKGKNYLAHRVVIATGTTDKTLNIPGIKNNRKIFYNWDIHKDRPAFQKLVKDKNVAVIGGGIDAMKKTHYTAQGQASHIKLFVRSDRVKVPCWRKRVMEREGIDISYGNAVKKIEDRGAYARLTNEKGETFDADIIVMSIGRTPRNKLFKDQVKINEKGFIVVDAKTQKTSIPGVYACGDVTDASGPQPQALIAVGNGMIAGYTLIEDLLLAGVQKKAEVEEE